MDAEIEQMISEGMLLVSDSGPPQFDFSLIASEIKSLDDKEEALVRVRSRQRGVMVILALLCVVLALASVVRPFVGDVMDIITLILTLEKVDLDDL
jgi:hypothetical protein